MGRNYEGDGDERGKECENCCFEVRLSFVVGRRWRAPRCEFKASNPEKEGFFWAAARLCRLEKLAWMDWSSEEEEEEEEEEE